MYSEFFRQNRWETDEAEDGRVALAKALVARPDAVVTEARLPGMAGVDLCRTLRTDPLTRGVAVVLLTSDARPQTLEPARACGPDTVLVKPCLPEAVWEAVEAVWAARRADQQRSRTLHVDAATDASVPAAVDGPLPAPRQTRVRAHIRQITTDPPLSAPDLVCPVCEKPLGYERSYTGGVNAQQSEQYDYYQCARGCGEYQYRHRTRRLRRM